WIRRADADIAAGKVGAAVAYGRKRDAAVGVNRLDGIARNFDVARLSAVGEENSRTIRRGERITARDLRRSLELDITGARRINNDVGAAGAREFEIFIRVCRNDDVL